ncbi:MAG: XdhC family protein [Stellaceae bacterium]
MNIALLQKALAASRDGKQAALATNLKTGQQSLIQGADATGNLPVTDTLLRAVRQAWERDESDSVMTGEGKIFIEIFNPRLRMLIVGAVHIAQPLARMAALTGYLVTVIDPRSAFASAERFPGVTLSNEWPDDAMKELKPDRRTAVVTLTHDPKLDDPALAEALKSDAFYIGALGSRKTHGRRCDRLRELGFTDDQFTRIHGPVGLKIGAISPAEIGIAIMAEVTGVLRGPAEARKAERAATKVRGAAA